MLDNDHRTSSQTNLVVTDGGEDTRSPGRRRAKRTVTRPTFAAFIVMVLVRGALVSALPAPPNHGPYPADMRVAFMAACERKGGAVERPLCGCVLSKLEARYPASRFEALPDAQQLTALQQLRAQCAPSTGQPATTAAARSGGYPQEFRTAFLSACEHTSGAGARPLCECVLTRLEDAYPAITAIERLSERERLKVIQRMGMACVKALKPAAPGASTPVQATLA
jgi:hypothetical protein